MKYNCFHINIIINYFNLDYNFYINYFKIQNKFCIMNDILDKNNFDIKNILKNII